MTDTAQTPEPKSPDGDRAAALDVLASEIAGLHALEAALNGPLALPFHEAVDLLDRSGGRAIVSGIGKSGHVGTKIAATLASTGKPAQFVHAAEASHGDLGMIQEGDVVLALSKSGETAELSDLVAYTRRFSLPLIAMTGDPMSALGRGADITLIIPDAPEACPNGLAPTTSTTMMMGLGDALAVALLKRRNFSAHDFRRFHPGGKLGAQLMAVRDLMHTGDTMPLATVPTPMADVLVAMSAGRLGCIGITGEDGRLVGIITDGDLRRRMSPDLLSKAAGDLMTRDPKTIHPDMLAAEAVHFMNDRQITNLFVVEDACPVGVIHIHDMLKVGVA